MVFIFLPFVHNYTLPCIGRKNALIITCVFQALANALTAYLDRVTDKNFFLVSLFVIRIMQGYADSLMQTCLYSITATCFNDIHKVIGIIETAGNFGILLSGVWSSFINK